MQSPFLVSVILPAYNGAKFISEALASVFAQTVQPHEIIVVDDGSIDETRDIAARYPQKNLYYLFQENKGPASARNRGITFASGNMIAFIDVDDLWVSHKLEVQLSYFQTNFSLELVRGYTQLFSANASILSQYPEAQSSKPFYLFGSMLARRCVFDKVGLLNEKLYYGEDQDWFARAKSANIITKIHTDVIYLHRKHENNMTNQKDRVKKGLFETVRESIERHRQK